MDIIERKIGKITLINLKGQAVIGGQPERLSQLTRDRLQAGERLFIINLADCTRMDSTGLGELVKSHKLIADCEGVLKLAKAPPAIRSIFAVTNLEQLMEVFDSEQSAINSFGA
jgi:anti-sigma B factor antagonist